MNRKTFLQTCSAGCLGFAAFSTLLQGCSSAKIITSPIEGDYLVVPVTAFEVVKKDMKKYLPVIIVQNDTLRYPISVYRFAEGDYTALLMRCTHQGTELQVFGDKLQCPAHGSEFETSGKVSNGPADKDLRTFPITIAGDQLKISLA
jgi:Rieske Fe-S protein